MVAGRLSQHPGLRAFQILIIVAILVYFAGSIRHSINSHRWAARDSGIQQILNDRWVEPITYDRDPGRLPGKYSSSRPRTETLTVAGRPWTGCTVSDTADITCPGGTYPGTLTPEGPR